MYNNIISWYLCISANRSVRVYKKAKGEVDSYVLEAF